MRDFLKKNWLKCGLLAVVIVTLVFYLFSWRPLQKRNELLTNSIRCQQDGSQLLERMKRKLSSSQYYYGKPEFRFAPKLNSCLMNGLLTSTHRTGSIYSHFIRDVYTNIDLARYDTLSNDDGTATEFGDIEKYGRLEAEYFSN